MLPISFFCPIQPARPLVDHEPGPTEPALPGPLVAKKLPLGATKHLGDPKILGRLLEMNAASQTLFPKIKVRGVLPLAWQRLAFCHYLVYYLRQYYGSEVRLDFFYSGGVTLKLCGGEESYPKQTDTDVKVFVTGGSLEVFDHIICSFRGFIHQLLIQQFPGKPVDLEAWLGAYCPEQFTYKIQDGTRQLYRLSLSLGRDEDWLFIHEADRGRMHSVRAKSLLLAMDGSRLIALEGEVCDVLTEIREGVIYTERPNEIEGKAVVSSLDLVSQGWRFFNADHAREWIAHILAVAPKAPKIWMTYCLAHREGDYLGSLAFLLTSLLMIHSYSTDENEQSALIVQRGIQQTLGVVVPRLEEQLKNNALWLWQLTISLLQEDIKGAVGELMLIMHCIAQTAVEEGVPRQKSPQDTLRVFQSAGALFLLLPRDNKDAFKGCCYIAAPQNLQRTWELLKIAKASSWLHLQSPIQERELIFWKQGRCGNCLSLLKWITGYSIHLQLEALSPMASKAIRDLQSVLKETIKEEPASGDAKIWQILRISAIHGGSKLLYILLGDLLLQEVLFLEGVKITIMMLKDFWNDLSVALDQLYHQTEDCLNVESRKEAVLAYCSLYFEVPVLKDLPLAYLQRVSKMRPDWLVFTWSSVFSHLPEEVSPQPYLELFDQFHEEEKIRAVHGLIGTSGEEVLRQHLLSTGIKNAGGLQVFYHLWRQHPFKIDQKTLSRIIRWVVKGLDRKLDEVYLADLLTLSDRYLACGLEKNVKHACGVFLTTVKFLSKTANDSKNTDWFISSYTLLNKHPEARRLLASQGKILSRIMEKFSKEDDSFINKVCSIESLYDVLFESEVYELCIRMHTAYCLRKEVDSLIKVERTKQRFMSFIALGSKAKAWLDRLWQASADWIMGEPKVKAVLVSAWLECLLEYADFEEACWWPLFSLSSKVNWKIETLFKGLAKFFASPEKMAHERTLMGIGGWLQIVDRMPSKEQKAYSCHLLEWKYQFCKQLFAAPIIRGIALEQQLEYVVILLERNYNAIKDILPSWGEKLVQQLAQEPQDAPVKESVRQGFHKLFSCVKDPFILSPIKAQRVEETRWTVIAVTRLFHAKVLGFIEVYHFMQRCDAEPLEGEILGARKALLELWLKGLSTQVGVEAIELAVMLVQESRQFSERHNLNAKASLQLGNWVLTTLSTVRKKIVVTDEFIPRLIEFLSYLSSQFMGLASTFSRLYNLIAQCRDLEPLQIAEFTRLWEVVLGPKSVPSQGCLKFSDEDRFFIVQMIRQFMVSRECVRYVVDILEAQSEKQELWLEIVYDELLFKALSLQSDVCFLEIMTSYCSFYERKTESIFFGSNVPFCFGLDQRLELSRRLIHIWKKLDEGHINAEDIVTQLKGLAHATTRIALHYYDDAVIACRSWSNRLLDAYSMLSGMVWHIEHQIDQFDISHQSWVFMAYVVEQGIAFLEGIAENPGDSKEWLVEERALLLCQMLKKDTIIAHPAIFHEILFIASKYALLSDEQPSGEVCVQQCADLYAQRPLSSRIDRNKEMIWQLGLQWHFASRKSLSSSLVTILLQDMLNCLDYFEGIEGCNGDSTWEPPKINRMERLLSSWKETSQAVKWPMLEVLAEAWITCQNAYGILKESEPSSILLHDTFAAWSRILKLLCDGAVQAIKEMKDEQGLWMMESAVHLFKEGGGALKYAKTCSSEQETWLHQGVLSVLELFCPSMELVLHCGRPLKGVDRLCEQFSGAYLRNRREQQLERKAKSSMALNLLNYSKLLSEEMNHYNFAPYVAPIEEQLLDLSLSWNYLCVSTQQVFYKSLLPLDVRKLVELSHQQIYQFSNRQEAFGYSIFLHLVEHLVFMKQSQGLDWTYWFTSAIKGVGQALDMLEYLLEGRKHIDTASFYSLWMSRPDSYQLWLTYLDIIEEQISVHQLEEHVMHRWMSALEGLFEHVFSQKIGNRSLEKERMEALVAWLEKKASLFGVENLLKSMRPLTSAP